MQRGINTAVHLEEISSYPSPDKKPNLTLIEKPHPKNIRPKIRGVIDNLPKDHENAMNSIKCLGYAAAVSTLAYFSGSDELHTFLGGSAAYTLFRTLPTLNNIVSNSPAYVKSVIASTYNQITNYQVSPQPIPVRVKE